MNATLNFAVAAKIPNLLALNVVFNGAVDIISAIEFDKTGDHLATGDRGGRVVLFERTDTKDVRVVNLYLNSVIVLYFCCNSDIFLCNVTCFLAWRKPKGAREDGLSN